MNFENHAQSFTQRQVEIEQAIMELRKQILKIKKDKDRSFFLKESERKIRFLVTAVVRPFRKIFN